MRNDGLADDGAQHDHVAARRLHLLHLRREVGGATFVGCLLGKLHVQCFQAGLAAGVVVVGQFLATLDVAKDFRGNTMVEKIGSEGLVAPMAQPLRKGIFDKGKRYLNATFLLEPELRARTIAFKVRDIRPAVGTVPQGVIDNYSVIDFFRLDPENPAIKANVKSLGGIYIENDQLVVETQIREDNAE